MRGLKCRILSLTILYLTIFRATAQIGPNETLEIEPEDNTDPTPTNYEAEDGKTSPTRKIPYSCNETKIIHTSENVLLIDYLNECPATKNITIVSQPVIEKAKVNIDIGSLKPTNNLEIVFRYVLEVHFEDDDHCNELIKFTMIEVKEVHMNHKLHEEGCVTFENKSIKVFIKGIEVVNATLLTNKVALEKPNKEPAPDNKSTITTLTVVVAILIVVVVSLLFYAFCFKRPTIGTKLEPKRSVTIEPADEIQAKRRPTILPETMKSLAEEASKKQKIRKNNSMREVKKPEVKQVEEIKEETKEEMKVVENQVNPDEKKIETPVLEAEVQVHAEDTPASIQETVEDIELPKFDDEFPDLVEIQLDQTKDKVNEESKEPSETKSSEEVKINVDISDDEAFIRTERIAETKTTPETDKDKKEKNRRSGIPVPVPVVTVTRSSSSDSAQSKSSVKSKSSNKSQKSDKVKK